MNILNVISFLSYYSFKLCFNQEGEYQIHPNIHDRFGLERGLPRSSKQIRDEGSPFLEKGRYRLGDASTEEKNT